MFGRPPENFLSCLTQALNKPIQTRCAELTVLFDRATLKDLHSVFPILIDNMFGPHSSMCWGLRNITNVDQAQDFDALQHFLSPQGPLFKVIYTLLRDPLLKFTFSINFLPSKVREHVDSNTLHPFYMDLIDVNLQTNQTVALMLNSFDYYFFHFAYHLINPFHQRYQVLTGTPWTTVYYVLCCDYVLHFLPTNSHNHIVPVLNFYNGKNPIYTLPSMNKIFRCSKMSKLLRANFLNTTTMHALDHHPRNEIWRSETIMTVFIDMWLSNDQVLNSTINFDKSFNMTQLPYKQNLKLNDVPTGEYIRIVRVLVKQLHAFSSSAKADDTHMKDLKKVVIPYLQGRMYIFLRHLIHSWPLDGSFRLVLELWLSFLQPWRYPGNNYLKHINQPEINPDVEDINIQSMKAVEREHMNFMAENLLAYTVLLQQLIPRFNRVDLSSPKISLILYRLTKVFGQPNLVNFLREIELSVQHVNIASSHLYHTNYENGLPFLTPTSNWSTNEADEKSSRNIGLGLNLQDSSFPGTKWGIIVKQKVLEYEGPSFCYRPIFIVPTANEIHELVWHIEKAQEVALSTIEHRLKEIKENSKGVFGFLKSLFGISEISPDEITLEERNKVPVYLQHSLKLLMDIFNINKDEGSVLKQQYENTLAESVTQFKSAVEDCSHLLTPQKVRERIKKIKYEGDPDLQPIQSYEVKFLVRLLYQLSSKINGDFGNEMQLIYYSNSYRGRLARQILCAPITIYKFDKSPGSFSPRIPQKLPPRISFRFFANYRVIFYLILLVVLSKLCGYSYFAPFYIIICLYMFYICLKTACENQSGSVAGSFQEVYMDSDLYNNESF
ncbi:hypothetical protein FQA39_LY08624 [Lamprigera yunnana]|nr:hypothetical protein FQA39_LY08624 [Lamprigera yunnana]